ncbi:unnamed protein product [Cuscuta europaea]|uniref:Ribosomal protein L1 n=1 Tax=Cuscuta europaea TaxID=41803 RepID=A0A9P0ZHY4_CUSEU|nr:unnamed protein product [Cuscuta europaea]
MATETLPAAAVTGGNVTRGTVEKAVTALLKWKDAQLKEQAPKLLPQDEFIYLTITLKKVPPMARTNAFRVALPHPLHEQSSERCLIIDDRSNSNLTSAEAKKIIKSQDVPISKVLKLSKLRTDYKAYEAKRKLCGSYDVFLVDKRIVHFLPKLLGKIFFKKKKLPLPVDLTKKNWKVQVERACGSGLFYLSTGTCSVMKVGKLSMENGEVVDNVLEAIYGVVGFVPKGWGGLRSFHLRLTGSLALPLYQALPDLKLKITGVKEVEGEGNLETKEAGRTPETGKKKRKGRLSAVRYMDAEIGEIKSESDGDNVEDDIQKDNTDLDANEGNVEGESDVDSEENEGGNGKEEEEYDLVPTKLKAKKDQKAKSQKGHLLNGQKTRKKVKRGDDTEDKKQKEKMTSSLKAKDESVVKKGKRKSVVGMKSKEEVIKPKSKRNKKSE